jgi:hypothetical protein
MIRQTLVEAMGVMIGSLLLPGRRSSGATVKFLQRSALRTQ